MYLIERTRRKFKKFMLIPECGKINDKHCMKGGNAVGFIIALLTILSSAGFLYYMGKSGQKWDMSQGEEE